MPYGALAWSSSAHIAGSHCRPAGMQPDLRHMGVVQAHRLLVCPLLRGLCIDEQAFTVNGIRNGANPVAVVCSCLGISHVLVACTDSLSAVMPH